MKGQICKNNNLLTRILSAVVCLITLVMPAFAQTGQFDITSSFRIWLLNNEARAISSLKSDAILIDRVITPFALMPFNQTPVAMSEEQLWELHYKFYVLLDEVQAIYTTARSYGSGRFGIVFKQHRPEIWGVLPLEVAFPGLGSLTAAAYRQAFHTDLLKALQLDADRDFDLSQRLRKAVRLLSDDETRLFNNYLETFSALYPNDNSARIIAVFCESGPKKQFAAGIKDFLKPVFTTSAAADMTSETTMTAEDPLAELEKLGEPRTTSSGNTGTGENVNGSAATAPKTLEPPPPGSEDLFKIWD